MGEFGGCGFFEWAPESQEGEPKAQPAVVVERIKCRCGTPVESRAVTKEGPNFGRNYLTCARGKRDFGGCGFFEWAPESQETDPKTQPTARSLPTPARAPEGQRCQCGTLVKSCVVKQAGPNFMRTFVVCATGKKAEGGCGLFEWVSEAQASDVKANLILGEDAEEE